MWGPSAFILQANFVLHLFDICAPMQVHVRRLAACS